MAIVFDEIEATVLPDTTPKPASGESGCTQPGAQADPHTLQSTLVRMMERAERLRAD